jgi:hypothetical protein
MPKTIKITNFLKKEPNSSTEELKKKKDSKVIKRRRNRIQNGTQDGVPCRDPWR